jgi:hypothetical protein
LCEPIEYWMHGRTVIALAVILKDQLPVCVDFVVNLSRDSQCFYIPILKSTRQPTKPVCQALSWDKIDPDESRQRLTGNLQKTRPRRAATVDYQPESVGSGSRHEALPRAQHICVADGKALTGGSVQRMNLPTAI